MVPGRNETSLQLIVILIGNYEEELEEDSLKTCAKEIPRFTQIENTNLQKTIGEYRQSRMTLEHYQNGLKMR